MKSHLSQYITNQSPEPFQRVGHLRVEDIDVFLALIVYRFGSADVQHHLRLSSSLFEMQWSGRGLVMVCIEKQHDCRSTELLYDCSDISTWHQVLDVLGLTSRLSELVTHMILFFSKN